MTTYNYAGLYGIIKLMYRFKSLPRAFEGRNPVMYLCAVKQMCATRDVRPFVNRLPNSYASATPHVLAEQIGRLFIMSVQGRVAEPGGGYEHLAPMLQLPLTQMMEKLLDIKSKEERRPRVQGQRGHADYEGMRMIISEAVQERVPTMIYDTK